MQLEKLAATVFVVTALVTMGIALATRSSLPFPGDQVKPLGELIFSVGMMLFVWTVAYLKVAFCGEIVPVTDELVTNGPYRYVRHPLYLSMMITLLGINVTLHSLWGFFSLFLIFLPSVIYRASLEESALARRFGQSWTTYVSRSGFLFPLIRLKPGNHTDAPSRRDQ